MKTIIMTSEVICIIYSCIFLYYVLVEDRRKDLKKNIFTALIIVVILTLGIDICKWTMESYPEYRVILYIITIVSIIMSEVETTAFGYYLLAHLNNIHHKSYWYAHGVTIANALSVLFTIVMVVQGKMYSFEDGVFYYEPLFLFVEYMAVPLLVYFLFLIIRNRAILGKRDTIAFISYLAIPLFAVSVEMKCKKMEFTYIASAISLAVIFVMLQSKEINEARMREEVLQKVTNIDSLIGLSNRRAYDTFLSSLSGEVGLGAIFFDLNGLKYTNDNCGHIEGDRLICHFAKMMKDYFGRENTYRISGDEFVVLLDDIKEEEFQRKVERFHSIIQHDKQISALGAAYSQRKSALELIAKAEEKMYEDKNLYHERNGQNRRERK